MRGDWRGGCKMRDERLNRNKRGMGVIWARSIVRKGVGGRKWR